MVKTKNCFLFVELDRDCHSKIAKRSKLITLNIYFFRKGCSNFVSVIDKRNKDAVGGAAGDAPNECIRRGKSNSCK